MSNKEKLKTELAVQLSAFANSGGGLIAFGVDEKDRTFSLENCLTVVGEQRMKDFLTNIIDRCTEQPVSDYKVHHVTSRDEAINVFVVEVGDSPAAPHQNFYDKIYYKRLDGKSVPAEHFYVELLRSRVSKTLLELTICDVALHGFTAGALKDDGMPIHVGMYVKNASLQFAEHWGVFVRFEESLSPFTVEHFRWHGGSFARGDGAILPMASQPMTLQFRIAPRDPPLRTSHAEILALYARAIGEMNLTFTPVSHNAIGRSFLLDFQASHWGDIVRERFKAVTTR